MNIRFNVATLYLLENVLTSLSPFLAFTTEITPTANGSVEYYMTYLVQSMRTRVGKERSVILWTRVMTIVTYST